MRARASAGMRSKTFSMVAPALYAGIRTKTFSTIPGDTGRLGLPGLCDVVAHGGLERIVHAPLRLPAEQLAGLADIGDPAIGVVVAFAVELVAGNADDIGKPHGRIAEFLGIDLAHHFGHALDGDFVVRRADIEDLPVAYTARILYDPVRAFDGVVDVGIAAPVYAAVDELHLRSEER